MNWRADQKKNNQIETEQRMENRDENVEDREDTYMHILKSQGGKVEKEGGRNNI